ncbi:MAG: biopolymer transporter ExbD [Myxococcales bacterium]|nr:biopolymer transporter ExbD [Myxococcales bacterium]
MGASVGKGGGGPMADINVTPLIDVVLVLLVVFMVITPLLSSGLPVDLPMATQTVTVNDAGQHVVISMTKEGTVAVDQEFFEDLDNMIAAVRTEIYTSPEPNERKVLVKADRSLEYAKVREVLDKLAESNFASIYIAAGKEK